MVWAPLEHAVVVLEQRHARETAGQPRANGRLGRGGTGVVVQRGRLDGSVGLVKACGRHGGGRIAGARAGVGWVGAVQRRGRHRAVREADLLLSVE